MCLEEEEESVYALTSKAVDLETVCVGYNVYLVSEKYTPKG